MGILQQRQRARHWYMYVSQIYEPLVSETFWPRHLQQDLLSAVEIDPDEHILDMGCGTGLTSQYASERGATVDAIDHSSDQLGAAEMQRSDDEIRFLQADAQTLPYEDDTFDRVISVGAILYFPDPEAAIAEAYRVTRPGGRVLVAGFHQPQLPSLNPVENTATLLNSAVYCSYDREEATEMFETAGWDDIDHRITGPLWHPRLVIATTAQKA